jgi:hypothetical protein
LTSVTTSRLLRPGHYDTLYPRNPGIDIDIDELKDTLNKRHKLSISTTAVVKPAQRKTDTLHTPAFDASIMTPSRATFNSSAVAAGSLPLKRKNFHDDLMLELSNKFRVIIHCNYLQILQHGGLWVEDLKDSGFYASASSLEDLFEQISVDMAIMKQRILRFVYGDGPNKVECTSLKDLPDDQSLHPVIDRVFSISVNRQDPICKVSVDKLVHLDVFIVTNITYLKALLFHQMSINRHAVLYHGNSFLTDVQSLQAGDTLRIVEIIPVSVMLASQSTMIVNINLHDSIAEVIAKLRLLLKVPANVDVILQAVDGSDYSRVVSLIDEDSMSLDAFHDVISRKCALLLSYCAVGIHHGCFGKYSNCFQLQDGCQHMLCYDCFTHAANSLPARPVVKIHREHEISSASASASAGKLQTVQSIFTVPDAKRMESDRFFRANPVMRKLPCPVLGCCFPLSEKSIRSTPLYKAHLTAVTEEIADYDYELSKCKQCALQERVCFDDQPCPVNELVQLDCEHFFHAECIALHLKQQVEDFRRILSTAKGRIDVKSHPFSCPVCEQDRLCWCPSCLGSRSHIILEKEIKYIQQCDSAGTITAEILVRCYLRFNELG